MRVLIPALGANMGGAMRHLTNFLPELCLADPQREYVVLVRESFPAVKTQSNVRLVRVADGCASGWLRRLTGDLIDLPLRVRREKFAAIVSLTNCGPIWVGAPHVLFQRNSIYYSAYYLDRIAGRLKLETVMRRRLAVESMKRAAVVVTPSDSMAAMIRQTCPATRRLQFKTLYHGFSRETLTEPLNGRYAALLDTPAHKLLYPTHPGIHKGFEVLFEALAELKRRRSDFCLFTTISREDWPDGVDAYHKRVQELGLQDHVRFIGRVPQSQMGAVYGVFDLMIYPSLCESFGFSMVEAMGYGLPVVAAGTPVNREICRDGAVYYEPLDPIAGADAIDLALDPSMREQLARGGQRRVQSYDWGWKRYAREFVEMIGRVA